MARYTFKLPDIGEGTAEAELVAWHVSIGDTVEEDQPLADVMTDKATVEITSPVAGRIVALHGEVGSMAAVGSPLAEFETSSAGEPVPDATPASPSPVDLTPPDVPTAETLPPVVDVIRLKMSPAVRRRAREAGIPIDQVRGSGPNGRIRQLDLDAFLAYRSTPAAAEAARIIATPAAIAFSGGGFRDVRLAGLRRRIAEKMELSTRRIPHFAYVEEVDVTDLEDARLRLNARYGTERGKLTFLPFFVRALCQALPAFPQINATYDEDTGTARYFVPINLGIATQTDGGLMVPVVRDAARRGLWDVAGEIARLAEAARDGTAKRDELSGSTITITSLGALGGMATTPVINHPEVAIIGPNRIVERPVAYGGSIALRKMMNISSSFDHRVIDGQDAAKFVQALKELLEDPALLMAF